MNVPGLYLCGRLRNSSKHSASAGERKVWIGLPSCEHTRRKSRLRVAAYVALGHSYRTKTLVLRAAVALLGRSPPGHHTRLAAPGAGNVVGTRGTARWIGFSCKFAGTQ
jgi:hypothetical protein